MHRLLKTVKHSLVSSFVLSAAVIVFSMMFITPARSEKEADVNQSVSNEELLRRIDILAEEIEKVKAGRQLFVPAKEEGKFGMGPAASKVYETAEGLSIGVYGELVYENYSPEKQNGDDSEKVDKVDALRNIIYIGYRFSDSIIFNSEIEIEHADEIYLEFAYIDFMFKDCINLRTGMILAPMGFINELHEPPMYLGSKRPVTEQFIIPTTWREIGAGIFGSLGDINYRLYVMNSFDGKKFSSDQGLRKGRQKGSEAKAEDFGLTVRIDYEGIPGLLAGVSGYHGNTGQENGFSAATTIMDAKADFRFRGLQLRGLIAYARVEDAESINELASYTGTQSVGSEMFGYYLEAGYDILRLFETRQQFILFARYEKINTQQSVPDGYEADPANDQEILTAGFSYKPIFNIVFKFDYQWITNGAETGINQYNIAMGYMF